MHKVIHKMNVSQYMSIIKFCGNIKSSGLTRAYQVGPIKCGKEKTQMCRIMCLMSSNLTDFDLPVPGVLLNSSLHVIYFSSLFNKGPSLLFSTVSMVKG